MLFRSVGVHRISVLLITRLLAAQSRFSQRRCIEAPVAPAEATAGHWLAATYTW
jgi:hypothetical protein